MANSGTRCTTGKHRRTNGMAEQDWEAPNGSGRQLNERRVLPPADTRRQRLESAAAGSANDSGAAPGGGIMDGSLSKGRTPKQLRHGADRTGGTLDRPEAAPEPDRRPVRERELQHEGTLDKALCILETSAYPPLGAATYRMIGAAGHPVAGTMTDTSAEAAQLSRRRRTERRAVRRDPRSEHWHAAQAGDNQGKHDHNHPLYFTPAPKTEQRQEDATLEAQQTLAVGTVVDYRCSSRAASSTRNCPSGRRQLPTEPGITHQYTITCANVGSTTVGMTCTMPGAGTLSQAVGPAEPARSLSRRRWHNSSGVPG